MKNFIVSTLLVMLAAFANVSIASESGGCRGYECERPMFPMKGNKQEQEQDQHQEQDQYQDQQINFYGDSEGVARANANARTRAAELDGSALVSAARNRVPNAYAPPLTTSNDTCMGSSSIGGSGPGLGLSIGSTWTDNGCVARADARVLWNMGLKDEAIMRLCERPKMAAVLDQCASE